MTETDLESDSCSPRVRPSPIVLAYINFRAVIDPRLLSIKP
jgi:hypothetical protein